MTVPARFVFILCLATLWAGSQSPERRVKQYQWKNVEIVGGGFVTGIVTHPAQAGLIYARTDIGGAYRWDAGALRWIPLTDFVGMGNSNLLGIESIGIDPNDPARLFLAAGTYTQSWAGTGAIFRSTDQGQTFQTAYLPIKLGANEDGRHAGERLAVDPNSGATIYFGSRNDGLWKSADSGITWNKVTSFPITGATNGIGIAFVLFDATGASSGQPSTVYAGVSATTVGLYRSTDGGTSWQAVSGQPTGLLPNHGVLAADGALYMSYGDQPGPNNMTTGAVWKYNTRASTWTNVTPEIPGGTTFGYGAVAVDIRHAGTVMATTMDRWSRGDEVFRSTDGGATWTNVLGKAAADNSLSPWLNFHQPMLGWWMGALAIDPFAAGHVMYGTGTTIWRSSDVTNADAGQTVHWTVGAEGLEETAVLGLVSPPSGPALLSALGDLGGFRHDDLRVSPPSGVSSNPIFSSGTSIDFAELNPAVVARVGSNGSGRRGAYSKDGGATWTPFGSEPAGSTGSGTIAVAADGHVLVWAAQGAAVSYSTDLGTTWTASSGVPSGTFPAADRVNPNKCYAFDSSTGRLLTSTDGGATFSVGATGLPRTSATIRPVPGVEGDVWIVANNGLYHSTDSGATAAFVTSASQSYAIGFGRPASGQSYPALYLAGIVAGVQGIYRSDDGAATWIRINDDQHQYGWIGSIAGDPRVYGRVYLGTNGRGIVYGELTDQRLFAGH